MLISINIKFPDLHLPVSWQFMMIKFIKIRLVLKKLFSKQRMSSVKLYFFFSCYVFRQQFSYFFFAKHVKCSTICATFPAPAPAPIPQSMTVGAPDIATLSLHLILFSASLTALQNFNPVHSEILFSQRFFCWPLLLPPCTVPSGTPNEDIVQNHLTQHC